MAIAPGALASVRLTQSNRVTRRTRCPRCRTRRGGGPRAPNDNAGKHNGYDCPLGLIVETYLAELARELRVPCRLGRRILAEVEGHLVDASRAWRERGVDASEAERRATADFGSPNLVARRFGEELAARSSNRSTNTVALALLAFVLLEGVIGLNVVRETSPWAEAPYGVVVFFALQVAIVAGALTLIRSLCFRRSAGIEPAALRLIGHGNLVVTGAIGVSVSLQVLVALGDLSRVGESTRSLAVAIGIAVVSLVAAAALGSVVRARRRASAHVAGSARAASDHDAVADLVAFAELARAWIERRAPRLAPAFVRMEPLVGSLPRRLGSRAPRLSAWLDLRRHPWRFAVVVAAAAGLIVAAQHAIVDGGLQSVSALPGALLASLLLASTEAAGALIGFALLGRYLGIRER